MNNSALKEKKTVKIVFITPEQQQLEKHKNHIFEGTHGFSNRVTLGFAQTNKEKL